MNKKTILATCLIASTIGAFANQQQTSNENPAYSQSNVQAQLRLHIKENAEVVHFIRDTNDPKIITKTYVLKHADPYSIRPYIREMVQALRVNYNNDAALANTSYYNTYTKTLANGSKVFVPTGVECIKYSDGVGVIMVSAEEYRFKSDPKTGMGIDELIATLDAPGIMNSSGQPKFIYFPKNRSAAELKDMIKLVGANVSNDVVELIGGKDKVEVDEDLNCLFFNTALYSRKNIEEMLKLYDVPQPEVKISCTIYELSEENDGMLGLDFQSWKNNDGAKLFQTGATFSKNYNLKDIVAPVIKDGTINSHYFNFQPKWNTKFLDFLVSRGKAKVITTGELAVQNGNTGSLNCDSGVLYAALTTPTDPATGDPNYEQGKIVNVKVANDAFQFALKITPSITTNATSLSLEAFNRSFLGYDSNGVVRTSDYKTSQKLMLGNGNNRFYLGGIEKSEIVKSVGGVPLLKDLPILGWIFATERESTKKSRIVVVANCEVIKPDTQINNDQLKQINVIKEANSKSSADNSYGYRQFFIDNDR